MRLLGINPKLTALVQSSFSGRTFRIKKLDVGPASRPIRAGIPQGSILGPELFFFFTSDILTGPDSKVAIYADDTALSTTYRNDVLV